MGPKKTPYQLCVWKKFEIDHAMNCLTGGFIHKRHDGVRDVIAKVLNEVAYDVETEPALQPLTGENLPQSTNTDDQARLDIAADSFLF